MLKTRYLIGLAAVLVILAAIKIVQDRRHDQATSRSGVETVLPDPIVADDLGRIAIGFGADAEALVLENQPDGWIVATAWNAAANPSRIEGLIESLDGLQGEFRSDSAAVLADYGFADSTTVAIVASDRSGAEVCALEIGRKPDRAPGNFIRRRGENTVYLGSEPIMSRLGIYGPEPEAPSSRHFVDLEASRVAREEIAAIVLRDGDNELAIEKEFPEAAAALGDTVVLGDPTVAPEPDRNVWEWRLTTSGNLPAVKTKADAVLGAVATVRAADVVDPGVDPAIYGLAEPTRTAVVRLLDGSETVFAFGNTREAGEGGAPAGTYLRIDDDPTVWVVSEYVVKNIFKTREDLLPAEEG